METFTAKSYSTNPKAIKTRLWKAANPERWKAHMRTYWAKKRKPCKLCKKPLNKGLQGRQYHKKCAREVSVREQRVFRTKAQSEFNKYKTGLGCSRCGYNRCGAALDFHHLDPSKKERRIQARDWKFNSPSLQAEIAKCILLCKNCHFEEHHLQ